MANTEIFDRLIRLFEIASTLYGTILFKDWLERKRNSKKDDVGMDMVRKRQATEITERLRSELSADRVLFWLFSNGDTTLHGYHLKKMSVFAEGSGNLDNIGPDFQLVPTNQFERVLDMLHDSPEGFVVIDESDYSDTQSALADQYGIDTILSVKVKTDTGRWIGMLSVCYSDKRSMDDGEIALAQLQSAVLGAIK